MLFGEEVVEVRVGRERREREREEAPGPVAFIWTFVRVSRGEEVFMISGIIVRTRRGSKRGRLFV